MSTKKEQDYLMREKLIELSGALKILGVSDRGVASFSDKFISLVRSQLYVVHGYKEMSREQKQLYDAVWDECVAEIGTSTSRYC